MANQKVTNIYNLLSANGLTKAKDVNEFSNWMAGSNYRQNIYGLLKQAGVEGIGSGYGEFTTLTGYGKKQPADATQKAQSIGQSVFGGGGQTDYLARQDNYTRPGSLVEQLNQRDKEAEEAITKPLRETAKKVQNRQFTPQKIQYVDENNKVVDEDEVYPVIPKEIAEDELNRMAYDRLQATNNTDIDAQIAALDKETKDVFQNSVDNYKRGQKPKSLWGRMADVGTTSAMPSGTREYMDMVNAVGNNPEYKNRVAALNLLKQASYVKRAAEQSKKSSGVGGWFEDAGFGMKEAAKNVSTWDMGATTATDAKALYDAAQKFDNGEKLSESEQQLLNAAATYSAFENTYGGDVSSGVKAGQITTEALPFMAEMLVNPASGTGRALQKKFIGKGMTELVKNMVKSIAKKEGRMAAAKELAGGTLARVGGDLLGAAVMAGTTGAQSVAGDTYQRMQGQSQFGVDANGNIQYSGRGEDRETNPMVAAAKAFGARTIENHSEMVGAYFAPALGIGGKVLEKGLRSMKLGGVVDFIKSMGATKGAKLVDNFFEKTKWDGTIGEYAEEVVGGIENALVVGDQTLDQDPETGVFNGQQNVETFLSVALMGGFLSTFQTGVGALSYAKGKQQLNRADYLASEALGEEWSGIKQTIDHSTAENASANLSQILSDPNMSPEQKQAVREYAKRKESLRGVLYGEESRKKEKAQEKAATRPANIDVAADGQTVVQKNQNGEVISEEKFDDEEEAKAHADILKMQRAEQDFQDDLSMANDFAEQRRQAVENGTPDDFPLSEEMERYVRTQALNRIIPDSVEIGSPEYEAFVRNMDTPGTAENDILQEMMDSFDPLENAYESVSIDNDSDRNEIDKAIKTDPVKRTERQQKLVSEFAAHLHMFNFPKGELHPEQSFADGQTQAELDGAGTMEADPEAMLQMKQSMDDAKQALDDAVAQNTDLAAYVNETINSNEPFAPEDVISGMIGRFSDDEIATVADYINAQSKLDGYLEYTNGKIQQYVERETSKRAFKGKLNGAPSGNMVMVTDGKNQYFLVKGDVQVGENGEILSAGEANGIVVVDEEGNILPMGLDSSLRVEMGATLEEYASSLLQQQQENTTAQMGFEAPQENGNNESDESNGAATETQPTAEEEPVAETQETETPEEEVEEVPQEAGQEETVSDEKISEIDSALAKIPTRKSEKDGEPDYIWEDAPAEDTIDALAAINDGNMDAVSETATMMRKEAESELKKAEKLKTSGKNPIEMAKSRAENRQKVEDAQKRLDYWKAVEEQVKGLIKQAEEAPLRQAEEEDASTRAAIIEEKSDNDAKWKALHQLYDGTIADDGEILDESRPMDINELVAMNMPRNIAWESYTVDGTHVKRGLQDELGSHHTRGIGKNVGTNAFNTFLAKKGTGISIDEAIHQIWESGENELANGEKRFSDQEIRNAVIDMFLSAERPSDITNYVVNNRSRLANEKMRQEEEYMREQEANAYADAEAQARGFADADEEADYNEFIAEEIKLQAEYEQRTEERTAEQMPPVAESAEGGEQGEGGTAESAGTEREVPLSEPGETETEGNTESGTGDNAADGGVYLEGRESTEGVTPTTALPEGSETDAEGEPSGTVAEEAKGGVERRLSGLSDSENDRLVELRKKLKNVLNRRDDTMKMEVIPGASKAAEIISIGTEIGFLYAKNGIVKFREFCENLILDIGEEIRPYLKSIYNAARYYPGMEDIKENMSSFEEVDKFDVANFDKETPDLMDKAKQIRDERKVEKSVKDTQESINYDKQNGNTVNVNKKENNEEEKGVTLQEEASEEKPKTKDGWLKKMNEVFKQLCEKYGVPDEPLIYNQWGGRYNFDYRITKGYRLDQFEPYYEAYKKKLDDDVEPATEKQLALIDRLAEPAEREMLHSIKLNKVSASYVISILKAAEDAITSRASTASEFEEYSNELEKVAKLHGWKPAPKLEGDSVEFAERQKKIDTLREKVRAKLKSLVMWNDKAQPMSFYKKLAEEAGLSDLSSTDLQEIIEAEVVNYARELASKEGWTDKQKYDHIVRLYNAQPSLNARDNDRINLQQYSTPAPMAYLMGLFTSKDKKVESGLEPSAGNGMLTINLPKEKMQVNDIDEMRLSNLQKQGFGEVTSQDGTQPFGEKQYDVVVTNPPFGSVTPKVYDGLYEISGLEHQMAINALESMKDDGRAAIIIGGNTEYNANGTIKGKDRVFLNYLYAHYNVVDVINMDGKTLYSRQGTGYPVRMILINGRKEFNPHSFAPVQSKARAEQVKSYDELYNRVNDDILRDENKPAGVHDTESGTSGRVDDSANAGNAAQTGVRGIRTAGSQEQPSGRASDGRSVQRSDNASVQTDNGSQPTVGGRPSGVGGRTSATETSGRTNPETGGQQDLFGGGNDAERLSAPADDSQRVGQRGTGSTQSDNGTAVTQQQTEQTPEVKRGLGTEKVPYRKQSGNPFTLQSLMPAEQADVVKEALEELGDVDQFLVDELGYSSKEELHQALAAEQIDSVAMAIHQMNQGSAFIIGDQTGIGKGRQAAALIRYGVKKGGCPVFITVKKALFSDMYRDLCDIGSPGLRPFIWSADDAQHSGAVTDKDGKVIYEMPSKKEQERVVAYINKHGKLPPEYDYVLTTYDSFKSGTMDYEGGQKKARNFGKKRPSSVHFNGQAKRDALETLAGNSYVIMDESHNAGGEGSNVGYYLQYITTRAKGITFLSATFAKRPGNMPIYSLKTAISKAGVAVNELIDAVKRGGTTFQEIMSKALTEAGQMIRRERDMTGVTIDWRGIEDESVIQKQREQYDKVIGLFNDIINFQRTYVDPIVDNLNDQEAEVQGSVDHTPGTRDMGINNTPFASRTYNMVQQILLSLKAEEAAKRAIEHLKAGHKPVITVANTNEGAADEVAAADGDSMAMPDLSVNLKKGLRGTLRITRKDAFGNTQNEEIPFDRLSPEGQARYAEIMDAIENASTGLSLSPIDVIKNELKKAGYKVGELTGRQAEFVYNEDGTVKRVKRTDTDKKKVAADFNNGNLDALILNRSAGTGISLHASTKFKDQRQRVMIVAQAQGDVNDEVQIRGRIDRTGQVLRGMYEYVVSQIPSEQRLLMMLKSKLRSLDANTTSSQKSKFNEMDVQDIINKYGDAIVVQYLAEHPDLAEKMQNPLKWKGDWRDMSSDQLISEAEKAEGDGGTASKVLGRMALLTVKEQEQMLDEIGDLYQAEIDRLDEMGENDLEITEMPLKAKTLSKAVWEAGIEPGGNNPFADNTYVEKVQMDVLKKPMKGAEVKGSQERLLRSTEGAEVSWEDFKAATMAKVNEWAEAKKAETRKSITERAKKKATAEQEKYVKGAKKSQEKNGLTDAEIEKNGQLQYDHFYNEEMEKLDKVLAGIEAQRQVFEVALDSFSTDGVYAIPMNIYDLGSMTFEPGIGKLIDVKISENFSPNSSTLTFATLDGRRKITVPINGRVKQQNGEKRELFPVINTLTAQTRNGMFGQNVSNMLKVLGQNLDSWDKLTSTAARKEGYIITGNLLKALVSTREQGAGGKLISYTTDTGEVRQGILMPDNFDPGALTSKTPISSMKDELRYNRDKVESADGDVSIRVTNDWDWTNRGYNTLELTVPKSKKKGEKYFNDEVLLSLMNGQFEGSGKMKAEFPRANLDAVMKRLDEMGVTVKEEKKDSGTRMRDVEEYTEEEQRKNEEISPEEVDDSGTRFRIVEDEDLINNGTSSAVKMKEHITKVAKKIGTKVVFHDDASTITNAKVKKALQKGKRVTGWYDPKDNSVHFYMRNIKDRYEAEKTIRHEVVGHKGMRALLGEEGYRTFMRRLWMDMSGDFEEMHQWVVENYMRYDGDLYETMDEWFAYNVVEPSVPKNLWDKVMLVLSDVLRKLGFMTTPNMKDMKYMLWLSRNAIKEGDAWTELQRNATLAKLDLESRRRASAYGKDAARARDGFANTPTGDTEREMYRNGLMRKMFAWTEAHQDYMASAKLLMDAILKGRKVLDKFNFYMKENHADSKIKIMEDLYVRDYCKPMEDAINRCVAAIGGKLSEAYEVLEDYMAMKHGLERNREFFVRDWMEEKRKKTPTIDDLDEEAKSEYESAVRGIEQGFEDGTIETEEERDKELKKALEDSYSSMLDRIEEGWAAAKAQPTDNLAEWLKGLDDYIRQHIDDKYEAGKHDYSGLTSFNDNVNDNANLEDGYDYDDDAVVGYVMDMESKIGEENVTELWKQKGRMTQFALDIEHEAGLITDRNYDKVSQMFHWYMPLRKWDEDMAEDIWSYMNSKKNTYVGRTLMKAGGRKSRAAMPIGTMFAMGGNAISRAARNEVKKAFAGFVRMYERPAANNDNDHDNDPLVTELEAWVENLGTEENPDWVYSFPDIPENATADEVREAKDAWAQHMLELMQEGRAMRVRQGDTIPYRFESKKRSRPEHIVEVYEEGQPHFFIVNDNPRAAQAINGQLKPETKHKMTAQINRFMSSVFTSYSPTFMARNAFRDAEFASSMLSVKEGWDYCQKFMKNYMKVTNFAGKRPLMFTLFRKFRDGTLDESDKMERYFKEFAENGGITGYVMENNAERWEKEILAGVKEIGENQVVGITKNIIKRFMEGVEHAGEAIENAARFATYVTSRESGRTVTKSVNDAKEVSVNFNRKGAGHKTESLLNEKGEKTANNVWAAKTAQYMRANTLFYNASLQGIVNSVGNAVRKPWWFAAKFAIPPMVMGALIPVFNAWVHAMLDDDDDKVSDDPYADLPEYTRRMNMCLYIGHGKFLMIPLSIEHRAFFGLGDIMAGQTYDEKLKNVDKPLAVDAVSQLTAFSPVDYNSREMGIEGVTGWGVGIIVPAYISPLVNAYFNKSWTGSQIQKENAFGGSNLPEYQKAKDYTNKTLVGASRMWHELWGGNDAIRAGREQDSKVMEWIGEVSPAKMEYVVEQYFGEPGKLGTGVSDMFSMMFGDKEADLRKIPVVKAFATLPNENTQFRRANTKYWKYRDEFEKVEQDDRQYRSRIDDDPVLKLEYENKFKKSKRYKQWRIYHPGKGGEGFKYKKNIEDLQKRINAEDDPVQKRGLQHERNILVQQLVDTLDNIE